MHGEMSLWSFEWWITVGIGGIIVHLVAMYLHRGIGSFLDTVSSRWKARSAAKKAADAERTAKLVANPELQRRAFEDEMRCRARAVVLVALSTLVIAFFWTFMASAIGSVSAAGSCSTCTTSWHAVVAGMFGALSSFCLTFAMYDLLAAAGIARRLRIARRLEDAASGF